MRALRLCTVSALTSALSAALAISVSSSVQARPKVAQVILGLAGAALAPIRPPFSLGPLKPRRHAIYRHRRAAKAAVRQRAAAGAGAVGAAVVGTTHTPQSSGPRPFLPSAYDAAFAFVLGREDGLRFWVYGFDDLTGGARGALGGPAVLLAGSAPAQAHVASHDKPCLSADRLNWPSVWLHDRTLPNTEQSAMLRDFAAALQDGGHHLSSACPPLTVRVSGMQPSANPAGADRAGAEAARLARLDSLYGQIWALRQAVAIARGPLEQFYTSLSDDQRSRLAAKAAPADMAARATDAGEVCRSAANRGLSPTAHPLQDLLSAACPRAPLPTLKARLDAVSERLLALEYAVLAMAPALAQAAAASPEAAKEGKAR